MFLALTLISGCDHFPKELALAAEENLARGYNTGDVALLERITAPEFVGIAPDGSRYDRKQMEEDAAKQFKSGIRLTTSGLAAQVYGYDTVVIEGYDHFHQPDGKPAGGTSWIDTWVRRDGSWLLASAVDVSVKE